MKKVLAVIVSILWLALIVGIPALALTGNVSRFIPEQLSEQLNQMGITELLAGLGVGLPSESNEPTVVLDVATPTPAVEPSPTPSDPPTPSPTPEPLPTATALPEPTDMPTPEEDALPAVAFPVSVRGQADLRTGPGLGFDSVGLAAAGATVLVSAQNETGEWFQLDDGNWIPAEALSSKPPVPIVLPGQEVATAVPTPETPVADVPTVPATPVVVVVNADANLRSGPGSTFDRVDGASFGTEVTVVGKFATDNWYVLDSGAWIFGELLDIAPDVPLVNADGTPVGSSAPTTATPVSTPAPAASSATPTSNTIANLRAAPNTDAAIISSTQLGQALVIVGKNAAGDWLKLDSGSWIFAELVDNAPADLPVVQEDTPTVAGSTGITATTTTTTTLVTAPAAVASTSSAAVDANLRSGPGTTFDLVGSITAGTALTIVGRNEAGDWLKLDSGSWIFGELVANAPADLPIATS